MDITIPQPLVAMCRLEINIILDHPALKAGTIKIKLTGDASYGEESETLPAPVDHFLNLSVEKGQKHLELTLIPKGEGKFDGEKTVSMKLETVSEGFEIGDMPQTTITLRDEIHSAKVSFMVAFMDIEESDELGSEILISIDGLVIPFSNGAPFLFFICLAIANGLKAKLLRYVFSDIKVKLQTSPSLGYVLFLIQSHRMTIFPCEISWPLLGIVIQ